MKRVLKKIIHLAGYEIQRRGARSVGAVDADPEFDIVMQDAQLSGWFQSEGGELLKGFSVSAEDDVLDVGCGDGGCIFYCANQGANVTFVDIDKDKVEGVVERLKGTPAGKITSIVSDANPLPLPDESFTRVISTEVLEHVDSPTGFLAELVRVGKPGAYYLFTVPDPLAENIQKELAPDSYFQKPNHIRIIARDEFEKIIQEAGLVVERRSTYGFYWALWWCLFWACNQDLADPPHPILSSWNKTWGLLLGTEQGSRVKLALDKFIPKSQAIIARKP